MRELAAPSRLALVGVVTGSAELLCREDRTFREGKEQHEQALLVDYSRLRLRGDGDGGDAGEGGDE